MTFLQVWFGEAAAQQGTVVVQFGSFPENAEQEGLSSMLVLGNSHTLVRSSFEPDELYGACAWL